MIHSLGNTGNSQTESIDGIFNGYSIDHQLRFELLDLFECGETVRIVYKPQLMRIGIKHGRFVLEA